MEKKYGVNNIEDAIISEIFHKNIKLDMTSKEGENVINEIFEKFNTKQSELNYKNPNILMGLIIESYSGEVFDNDRFNSLFELTKKTKNKYTKDDIDLLNTINDNWLKWSTCYNREAKNASLFNSSIDPMSFDFSEFQKTTQNEQADLIRKKTSIIFFENLDSVKNYDLKKSELPIISKKLEDGYSYRVKTVLDADLILTGENCMTVSESNRGLEFEAFFEIYNKPKTNVVFEVYKDGEAIANSWVRSIGKDVYFNSIEVKDEKNIGDEFLLAYKDYSLELVKKGFESITCGGSGLNGVNIGPKSLNTDFGSQKTLFSFNAKAESIKSLADSKIDKKLLVDVIDKIGLVDKELENSIGVSSSNICEEQHSLSQ